MLTHLPGQVPPYQLELGGLDLGLVFIHPDIPALKDFVRRTDRVLTISERIVGIHLRQQEQTLTRHNDRFLPALVVYHDTQP